ncbi:Uma2 family endonuclease [Sorangium sp. So ce1036]|uniref:Uma2 family endonuclease n=1 Tax=Sorangium sp. So ce1036 TaxID=3133328 RepID=UPI003EFE3ABA
MAEPARKLPAFDELYRQIAALPQGVTGEILEPGVIRTMSRPGRLHRLAHRRLLRSLRGWDVDEGGDGWWFEIEAEIRFPGDLLAVPDLSGWRASAEPAFLERNPIEEVPDFCCELLSPSTARDDRRLKLPLYARAEIAWIWLVDPEQRLVEVYQTENRRPALALTAADDDVLSLPPFGGEIDVGRFWPGLGEAPGGRPGAPR